jgi:ribosomal protein S6
LNKSEVESLKDIGDIIDKAEEGDFVLSADELDTEDFDEFNAVFDVTADLLEQRYVEKEEEERYNQKPRNKKPRGFYETTGFL